MGQMWSANKLSGAHLSTSLRITYSLTGGGMSRLTVRKIADLGSEDFVLYWLPGLVKEDEAWFVRAALRGMNSKNIKNVVLPIGLLPVLALGRVFSKGNLSLMTESGTFVNALIADMSDYEEVTSAQIPQELYSFGENKAGIQRLFRYQTSQGDVLIPTIELIRYLFLHNRTLANVLMRSSGLNSLFHPELPGYHQELKLRFTKEMPKSCLTDNFAEEFAWLALDPSARRSWDCIYLKSNGKDHVTFTPPALQQSSWAFRGIQHGKQWLVLELLHLSGKIQPCAELYYSHPSLKEVISSSGGSGNTNDPNSNGNNLNERIIYDYELDDVEGGAQKSGSKFSDEYSKQSDFDQKIKIAKSLLKAEGQTGSQPLDTLPPDGPIKDVHKTVKVSVGERNPDAKLSPLEFKLLTPATWESIGDLDALASTVRQMADKQPQIQFGMSLCQLKAGRAFSIANRMPRIGLVVTIRPPNALPIVLLDVERSGDVAISLIAMRFHSHFSFDVIEESVRCVFDGLVNSSGHWNHEAELSLSNVCTCERFPKALTPRRNAKSKGQTTLWAMKLLRKLGLEK